MKHILVFLLLFIGFVSVLAQEQQAAKVVHFKKLQDFLPKKTPDGFTAEKPKGSTSTAMGISTSLAEQRFTVQKKEMQKQTDDNGKEQMVETDVTWTIHCQIVDLAGTMQPEQINAMYQIEMNSESDEGSVKSIKIKNKYKGFEKVTSTESDKYCSLEIIIADRFNVSIEGRGFDDVKLLYSVLESIDLAKLEKLKP
jgi:hypothetical protein